MLEQNEKQMVNLDNIVAKANNRKRLTVGIDVDNVLFRIPLIEHLNMVFDEKYTYEHFVDWDGGNFPDHHRHEMFAAFKSPEFMCKTKSYLGNYSTIRDWKLAGHRMIAITRRAPNLYDGTRWQLEKEFPGAFSKLIFVAPNESKADWLLDVGADVHIDDYDVLDAAEAGIKTWLITNEETRYNWDLRESEYLNQALELKYVKLGKDEEKWFR
jgi:hypothetical protein